jgi:hypothetical protein
MPQKVINMRLPIAILLTGTLLVLGACSLLGSEPPALEPGDLTIQADASTYAPTDTVTVTFTNTSAADLLLMSDGCQALDDKPLPKLQIEKQIDSDWKDVTSHGCAAVALPPAPMKSDGAYTVRFQIGIVKSLERGTYRYLFDVRYEEEGQPGRQVAKEYRRSNTVEVNEQ